MRRPELHPNPENATPQALRVAMEAAPNKRSYIRLNAIRSVAHGDQPGHRWPAVLSHRAHGPALDRAVQSRRHGCAHHPRAALPLAQIGAVAPQSGALFSLIVEGVDTDVFQFFLAEMAKAIPKKEGVRQVLILDNASWHKAARLQWHHFEPKFLPGYSPDFNPIERLWLRVKADWFWDYFAPHPRGVDRTTLHRPQKLHRPAGQNRFRLLHPEMISGNHSSRGP